MKLENQKFQAIVNLQNLDLSTVGEDVAARVIEVATEVLTTLHTIEAIDGVRNLSGAIGLIEGTMKRLLRSAEAPLPKYRPHPSQIEAFLALDLTGTKTPKAHIAADDLANLIG